MPITGQLSFVGTGKPMHAHANPRLNRSAGWHGVIQSGNKKPGEMQNQKNQKNNVQPAQLGQGAVKLQKASGISVNMTI